MLRRIGFRSFLARRRAEGHRVGLGRKRFRDRYIRGNNFVKRHSLTSRQSDVRSTLPERSGTCFNRAMAVAPRVTIREIADRAGVSIATVSRVLNGREDVAPETRERRQRVIQENGYTANRSARGAVRWAHRPRRRPRPARLSRPTSPACSPEPPRRFARAGIQIVLSPTRASSSARSRVLERIHGLTDGALFILPRSRARSSSGCSTAATASSSSIRCMTLNERIPSVSAANTSGADQAMRHLLQLGHRRIAQITGPPGWVATEGRRRGYRAALASAGILPDPGARGRGDPRDRAGPQGCGDSCSTWPTRRPRSWPSTTTSRSARSRRRAPAACACRRTCRWSASTTSSTRRS